MGKFSQVVDLLRDVQRRSNGNFALQFRLFRRALDLFGRRLFSVKEILSNGLLDPALAAADLDLFASHQEYGGLIDQNVPLPYYCLPGDQVISLAYCQMLGLPTPRLSTVFDLPQGYAPGGPPLSGAEAWQNFLSSALPQDFFVKPAVSMVGKGKEAFHRDGERFIRSSDGKSLSISELYDWLNYAANEQLKEILTQNTNLPHLTRHSRKMVIQERLFSHQAVVDFTGSPSLSCIRVITFAGQDLKPRIISTSIKIITGGAFIDNFQKGRLGNYWATIDRETGCLTTTYGPPDDQGRYSRPSRHPRSGRAFTGFQVPYWREVCALAVRASEAFLPHPSIGWDIAVTPDGPVLIEGNTRWTVLPISFAAPVPEIRTLKRRGLRRRIR